MKCSNCENAEFTCVCGALVSADAPRPSLDRDVLERAFLETFEAGGLWAGLEPEAYKIRHRARWAGHFTDAVLALLMGARP